MSSLAMALANIKAESDSLSVSNSHRGSLHGKSSISRQGSFGNQSRGSTSRQSSFGSRQNSFGYDSARCNSNVCKFYLQGRCTRGSSCPFRHDQSSGLPSGRGAPTTSRSVCKFFLKGNCQHGSLCAFRHEISDDDNISVVTMGSATPLPLQSSAGSRQVCKFFAKGYCSRGDTCTFLHETISLQTSENTTVRYQPPPSKPREKPTIEAIRARAAKAKAKETVSLSSLVPKKQQHDESVLQARSDLGQIWISPLVDFAAGQSTPSLAKAGAEKNTTSVQTAPTAQNEILSGESAGKEKTDGSQISILPQLDSNARDKTDPPSVESKSPRSSLPSKQHAYSSYYATIDNIESDKSCRPEKIEDSSQVISKEQHIPLPSASTEITVQSSLSDTVAANEESQRSEKKPIGSSLVKDAVSDSGTQNVSNVEKTKDREAPAQSKASVAVDCPEEVVQSSGSSLLAAASKPSSLQAAANRKNEIQPWKSLSTVKTSSLTKASCLSSLGVSSAAEAAPSPPEPALAAKRSSLAAASSLKSNQPTTSCSSLASAATKPKSSLAAAAYPTKPVRSEATATSRTSSRAAALLSTTVPVTSSSSLSARANQSSKPSSSLAAAASHAPKEVGSQLTSTLRASSLATTLSSTTVPVTSSRSSLSATSKPRSTLTTINPATSHHVTLGPTQANSCAALKQGSSLGAAVASKPSSSLAAAVSATSKQVKPEAVAVKTSSLAKALMTAKATAHSPPSTASLKPDSFLAATTEVSAQQMAPDASSLGKPSTTASASIASSSSANKPSSYLASSLTTTTSKGSALVASSSGPSRLRPEATSGIKTSLSSQLSPKASTTLSSKPNHAFAPRSSLIAAASKPTSSLAAIISASKQVEPEPPAVKQSSLANTPTTAKGSRPESSLASTLITPRQAPSTSIKTVSSPSPVSFKEPKSSLASAAQVSKPAQSAPSFSSATASKGSSFAKATAASKADSYLAATATEGPSQQVTQEASSTFTSSLGKAATTVKAFSASSLSANKPNSSLASSLAVTSKGSALVASSLGTTRWRPEATSNIKTSSLASLSKQTGATPSSSPKLTTSATAPTTRTTSSLSAKLGPSNSAASVSNKSFLAAATQQPPQTRLAPKTPTADQEYLHLGTNTSHGKVSSLVSSLEQSRGEKYPSASSARIEPKSHDTPRPMNTKAATKSTSYAAALNRNDEVKPQHSNYRAEHSNSMILNPLPPEKSNPDSELKSVLGMSSPGKCDNLVPHKKLPPKRWGDESDSDSD